MSLPDGFVAAPGNNCKRILECSCYQVAEALVQELGQRDLFGSFLGNVRQFDIVLAFAAQNADDDSALQPFGKFDHVKDLEVANFESCKSCGDVLKGHFFDDGAHQF